MKPIKPNECQACKRELELTFHHLVPKKMHDKPPVIKQHDGVDFDHYGIWLCSDCHKKIHRTFSHKELAESYYTLDSLLQNEDFLKFVTWVSKQRKRVK